MRLLLLLLLRLDHIRCLDFRSERVKLMTQKLTDNSFNPYAALGLNQLSQWGPGNVPKVNEAAPFPIRSVPYENNFESVPLDLDGKTSNIPSNSAVTTAFVANFPLPTRNVPLDNIKTTSNAESVPFPTSNVPLDSAKTTPNIDNVPFYMRNVPFDTSKTTPTVENVPFPMKNVTLGNTPNVPDKNEAITRNVPFPLKSVPLSEATSTTTSTTTPSTTTSTMNTLWTTSKTIQMSKYSSKVPRKNKTETAQVSVLSHRLLNDIVVIPSSRKLYVLAILPIHQSSQKQGFECSTIDTNAFIRLAAFLDALKSLNEDIRMKEAGIDLGAVVVDSCSNDLRTVADLFELLSGTNIHRNDMVAIVRDDVTHMPNFEQLALQLQLPVVNTFFTTSKQSLTTSTLPAIVSPLRSIVEFVQSTSSSCVNVVFDHMHQASAKLFAELSLQSGICVEESINLSVPNFDESVRRLLLTQARMVVVLLGEHNWIEFMKSLRNEMVISSRFVLIGLKADRWSTSKSFLDAWTTFDQILFAVGEKKNDANEHLSHLTTVIPKMSFPQEWTRQFWAAAFHCHVGGNAVDGDQFSKECSTQQKLKIDAAAPEVNIEPISQAVWAVGLGVRDMIDRQCPGALVISLQDCINEPSSHLFTSIQSLHFVQPAMNRAVYFNSSTSSQDADIVISRVTVGPQIQYHRVGEWSSAKGLVVDSDSEALTEDREGIMVAITSTCPRTQCAFERAKKAQSGAVPMISEALKDVKLLVFTITSVISFLICLMCMYHQVLLTKDEYHNSTAFSFAGLSILCLCTTAFVMQPNAISCSFRKVVFPIAVSAVFAPLFVKSISIWRGILASDASPVRSGYLFFISLSVVFLQFVISFEWAFLTSSTEVVFESTSHGAMWRCAPGDNFEMVIFFSCALPAFMILSTFITSLLSLQHYSARPNVLISILAIILSIGLIVTLPLTSYKIRDFIMALALLLFSFATILISYCQGVFSSNEELSGSQGSLINKTMYNKKGASWLDEVVLSPREAPAVNYHYAATLPHNPVYSNTNIPFKPVAAHRISPPQEPMRKSLNRIGLYGSEAYELPPQSPSLPSNLNAKIYGSINNERITNEPIIDYPEGTNVD